MLFFIICLFQDKHAIARGTFSPAIAYLALNWNTVFSIYTRGANFCRSNARPRAYPVIGSPPCTGLRSTVLIFVIYRPDLEKF